MTLLDIIKSGIERLYKTNPNIHINVTMSSPRINLKNEPVVIKGVYPHIFQIEEQSTGTSKRHTLQYTDVLMHRVEILELGEK